jgi:hypothetical protein
VQRISLVDQGPNSAGIGDWQHANWRSEALQNDQLEVASVLNFYAAQGMHLGGYARVLASARVMLRPAGLAIGG